MKEIYITYTDGRFSDLFYNVREISISMGCISFIIIRGWDLATPVVRCNVEKVFIRPMGRP